MIAGGAARAMRRVPWGLIGALVLIWACERMVHRKIASFTTETAYCWGYSGSTARTVAKDGEILAFGDSLMKYGFLPRVIEARTGRSAFNLAVYGGPPSHDYLSLRRVLDAGGKPSALVECFQPVHFGSGPRFHAREFAEAITPREALDLSWWSGDPGLFGLLMVDRVLPSARARFEIRERIASSLTGGPGANWPEVRLIFGRNWHMNRGAHVQNDSPHAPEGAAAVARAKELYPHPIDVLKRDTVHEVYIRRFLDLATGRGIRIVWVLPPMLPEIRARMGEIGLAALTTDLTEKIRREYPDVVVLDGRDSGYAAEQFCPDAVHLNRSGANALSREIADVLRRRLGTGSGPEWVALPPYRPGPQEAALEDFAQSVKAVRSGEKIRR